MDYRKKIDTNYTKFAPAERVEREKLQKQINYFKNNNIYSPILNSIPVSVTIINPARQIVYANDSFLKYLNCDSDKDILGLRIGEAVSCVHAYKYPAGCGTTEFCSTCGAVNAILISLKGNESAKECRITLDTGDALNLMVWGNPLKINNETFSVFSLIDIADTKRRRALERIFFHDILNTAGSLRSFLQLIQDTQDAEEKEELLNYVYDISDSLIDEILEQKDLAAAESGELQANIKVVNPLELIKSIQKQFLHSEIYKNNKIEILPSTIEVTIATDKTLLRRVLANLIKNAIEASSEGDVVKVGYQLNKENNGITFWVNNKAVMPKSVRLQIFQRSFSTKGKGRGLGTYSVKLLTERYLHGKVSFTSKEGEGTTMYVELPLVLSDSDLPDQNKNKSLPY